MPRQPDWDAVTRPQKTKGLAEAKPLFLLLFSGAGGRNRTGDLRITNALLYQLSYTGARPAALAST
ncbi:hypothetical protein RA210_U40302 [Rubrivivax sp. A210]|nr:hypothetical protein RA210_U40302 [Rubrivivax sp. A210]